MRIQQENVAACTTRWRGVEWMHSSGTRSLGRDTTLVCVRGRFKKGNKKHNGNDCGISWNKNPYFCTDYTRKRGTGTIDAPVATRMKEKSEHARDDYYFR